MSGMTRVHALGLTPVRGTGWHLCDEVVLDSGGVVGDRAWTPVLDDLSCLRLTEVPHLVAVRVTAAELPTGPGRRAEVSYYGRTFAAGLHGGPVADRLSAAAGRRVAVAHTDERPGFVWSSPVSVLLSELAELSELAGLPGVDGDLGALGRYRTNIVIDDRESPLRSAPGVRLALGQVVVEVERELERCLVIDHDAATGVRDARLLHRLRPGVQLGFGTRVVRAGRLAVGDPAARA